MQRKDVNEEGKKSMRMRKGNGVISGTAWVIREQ
jgi:hypothetical protein